MDKRRDNSYIILYVILFGVLQITSRTPGFLYKPISKVLARLLENLLPKFKRMVVKNFARAFPELTATQQQQLLHKTFSTIIFNALLLGKWYRLPKEKVERFITCDGIEILDKFTGKPLVAISAHLGNFPLYTAYLQWQGYPLRYLGRHANNPYVNRMISRMLSQKKIFFFDKKNLRNALRKANQWLAEGKILCLHSDQYSGEGVKVNVFGNRVFAPTGAAVFARKYRCPVIGIFIEKKGRYQHIIKIEGPYPLQYSENQEEDIQNHTQFFFDRFVEYIRKSPEEWFTWTTRIFR